MSKKRRKFIKKYITSRNNIDANLRKIQKYSESVKDNRLLYSQAQKLKGFYEEAVNEIREIKYAYTKADKEIRKLNNQRSKIMKDIKRSKKNLENLMKSRKPKKRFRVFPSISKKKHGKITQEEVDKTDWDNLFNK